ncbi:Orf y [Tanacetum coccineum]
MSERFKQEIQYWYDNSRTVDPEYIVFNETSPKPTPTDLANNQAFVYSRLNLFSKVALKNYKSISEKQKELEYIVQNCQEKLESCEELLRKTQSETRKPAQQNPQPFYRPDYQFGYPQGKNKIFSGGYGEYYNSQWTLPPAWTESGVMLVLPADPGLWSEVISRWESITINRLNNQTWSDNKAKLAFVENLFGESKKLGVFHS